VAKEIAAQGTVDVLRHGVVDLGVTIRLAYFRPASGLAPALMERYGRNRLTVTRQFPYAEGSTKTLDLCLFVNGVPVATAELKKAMTGKAGESGQRRRGAEPSFNDSGCVCYACASMLIACNGEQDGAGS